MGQQRSEHGFTAVTVASVMLVLMGMAAIAIDGSNLYRERGDVQNTADLSAVAAAYEACIGGSDADAVAAGESQAVVNSYDGADPKVTVAVVKEDPYWRATIDSTIGGFFSNLLGAETLSTTATALAGCTAGGGNYPLIFAGGQCDDKTFEVSGQDDVFNGAVHSNDDLKLNGSDLTMGDTTYAGSLDQSGSNQSFTSGPTDTNTFMDWPLTHDDLGGGLSIDDFAQSGAVESELGSDYHFASSWDLGSGAPDGVYVATSLITVSGELDGSFTFVLLGSNGGYVEFSGQDNDITPFYEGILIISDGYSEGSTYPYTEDAVSTPKCDHEAVKISGSGNSASNPATYEGLVFAPRGMISIGGQHIEFTGGLMSMTLKYGGSNNTFNAGGDFGGDEPQTTLIQ